jgi:hypothetical protein
MLSVRSIIAFLILISATTYLQGQGLFDSYANGQKENTWTLSGFARSSNYFGQDIFDDYNFTSVLADMGLRIETGSSSTFRASAELRYRYGREYEQQVSIPDLREAWAGIYAPRASLEMGKKIIKWGRADFFSRVNMVTPTDDLYRSPDKSDRDLANLMMAGSWSPAEAVSLTALIIPVYRPSVFRFDLMDIPDQVEIDPYEFSYTETNKPGFGIRNDYHLRNIDFSLYFFDGYNKLPGIKLDMLRIPDENLPESPVIVLAEEPYKTRMLGLDMEGVTGRSTWRFEFSWNGPYGGSTQEEHIPFPELNWVMAAGFNPGSLQINIEYGGKYVIDWSPAATDPSIPGEEMLGQLLLAPPEVAEDAVREQIRSFNRLYNYQVEKQYHMAGINIQSSSVINRWTPDISAMYNFTTREIVFMPAILFKPFDRVLLKCGLEYWYGDTGSLYDYFSRPVNSAFISLKINF